MDKFEQQKLDAKGVLRIIIDYSLEEIVIAILKKDSEKIKKIKKRLKQLEDTYSHFCTEVDSGDKDRINIAMSSFKRPEK